MDEEAEEEDAEDIGEERVQAEEGGEGDERERVLIEWRGGRLGGRLEEDKEDFEGGKGREGGRRLGVDVCLGGRGGGVAVAEADGTSEEEEEEERGGKDEEGVGKEEGEERAGGRLSLHQVCVDLTDFEQQ